MLFVLMNNKKNSESIIWSIQSNRALYCLSGAYVNMGQRPLQSDPVTYGTCQGTLTESKLKQLSRESEKTSWCVCEHLHPHEDSVNAGSFFKINFLGNLTFGFPFATMSVNIFSNQFMFRIELAKSKHPKDPKERLF